MDVFNRHKSKVTVKKKRKNNGREHCEHKHKKFVNRMSSDIVCSVMCIKGPSLSCFFHGHKDETANL